MVCAEETREALLNHHKSQSSHGPQSNVLQTHLLTRQRPKLKAEAAHPAGLWTALPVTHVIEQV